MSGSITRASRHRRRATVAVAACVLWLLGVEVLPNIHLATHEADHTHEADGTIVRVSFGGTHSHGAGVVHADHHDDHDVDDDVDDDSDRDRRDSKQREQLGMDVPAHGAAGIAHHAIALHQPSPPMLEPLPVAFAAMWIESQPNERLTATFAARPAARGPPARG